MFKHSRNAVGGFLAAALVTAAALSAARQVRAQTGPAFTQGGPPLTVSIISPANGGGTPGQTLQAGVFAITNNLDFTQIVNSVTIAFTNPSMFSSATLKPFSPNGASGQHDVTGTLSFPTVSRPVASTTFTFSSPEFIGPGSQPVFALTVKLSPLSRNEPGNTAYAGMITRDGLRGAGAPLWMAFAMLGLATAALPGGKRRRVWLLAGLIILFAAGAPGCGGDSGNGPSSTQTVTAVGLGYFIALDAHFTDPPDAGLPLKLGTITGQ